VHGASTYASAVPVLPENHILPQWWCNPRKRHTVGLPGHLSPRSCRQRPHCKHRAAGGQHHCAQGDRVASEKSDSCVPMM